MENLVYRVTGANLGIKLSFGIDAWQAWIPTLAESSSAMRIWHAWPKLNGEAIGLAPSEPNVKFVDPMVRRRLNPFGRASLATLHALYSRADGAMPMVFASRHGDLLRTIDMLKTIAGSASISPTNFGLTVHNAVVGIAAILFKNTQPALAISAGLDTFWFGLADAVARSQATNQSHLYIFADLPTPDIYRQYADVEDLARVFACVIQAQQSGQIQVEGLARITKTIQQPDYPTELAFLCDLARADYLNEGRYGYNAASSKHYDWSWTIGRACDAGR